MIERSTYLAAKTEIDQTQKSLPEEIRTDIDTVKKTGDIASFVKKYQEKESKIVQLKADIKSYYDDGGFRGKLQKFWNALFGSVMNNANSELEDIRNTINQLKVKHHQLYKKPEAPSKEPGAKPAGTEKPDIKPAGEKETPPPPPPQTEPWEDYLGAQPRKEAATTQKPQVKKADTSDVSKRVDYTKVHERSINRFLERAQANVTQGDIDLALGDALKAFVKENGGNLRTQSFDEAEKRLQMLRGEGQRVTGKHERLYFTKSADNKEFMADLFNPKSKENDLKKWVTDINGRAELRKPITETEKEIIFEKDIKQPDTSKIQHFFTEDVFTKEKAPEPAREIPDLFIKDEGPQQAPRKDTSIDEELFTEHYGAPTMESVSNKLFGPDSGKFRELTKTLSTAEQERILTNLRRINLAASRIVLSDDAAVNKDFINMLSRRDVPVTELKNWFQFADGNYKVKRAP